MNFSFHHLGIAVRNLAEAMPVYRTLFGYEVVWGPLEDPLQRVSACFLRRGDGDTLLELVAPAAADSPIHQAIKKGGGAHHVCYEVDDIGAAMGHMTDHGSFLLSGPVPAIAFDGRPIAWLMTEGHLLVELLQASDNGMAWPRPR